MKPLGALLLLAIAATALRVAIVWHTDPSPQDAYYFLCSQRPAPAYFDGPGGTAFITELAAAADEKSDVVWRLLGPFWALCATLACFGFVWQLAGAARAVWIALVLNMLPIFNSWALRVGPELPALTFALLGMLAAWRASQSKGERLLWWVGAGLFLGAGSWFSYATIPILAGVLLIALSGPKQRRTGDLYGALAVVVIPALCLTAPLLWNAEQDWIPIAGGTFRTVWEFGAASSLRSLTGVLRNFSPLVLPAMLLGCVLALLEWWKGDTVGRFVFWCGLPAPLAGLYLIFRGTPADLYFLLVAPLFLSKAIDAFASRPRLAAVLRWSTVLLAGVFSCFAIYDSLRAGRGWRYAASELRRTFLERSAQGQEDLFLIGENPEVAAIVGYHLRNDFVPPAGHPTVYVPESQDISNQFGLWPSYADFTETGKVVDEYFTEQQAENPFVGRSALYITHEPAAELPQSIQAAFNAVTPLGELPAAGDSARPLYIHLCVTYQTLPL